jgi:FlaA1/EpsC-like NDP-sugar epimerase
VRVLDLAERLVARAGMRLGRDVAVAFTGLRPGERLQEQLSLPGEDVVASRHPMLYVVRPPAPDAARAAAFEERLDRLAEAALAGSDAGVVRALCDLLPEYRPSVEQEKRLADAPPEPPSRATPLAVLTGGAGS